MDGFFPHGVCLQWKTWLIILYAFSNAAIGLAYMGIPFLLWWKARQERVKLPINNLFIWFIWSCGVGHFITVGLIWWPAYKFGACWDSLTATASWACLVYFSIKGGALLQFLNWPEQQAEIQARLDDIEHRIDGK